jgi:hypothetical protein
VCHTYHWKSFNKGYNFSSNLILIEGLYKKLWASKVSKVPISKKLHLGAAFMVNHKEYYKGEGGGFLEVWAMVSLVSLCMLGARPCTKSVPSMD